MLGLSLRSFPSTVIDVEKENVTPEALAKEGTFSGEASPEKLPPETFYEITYEVKISTDDGDDDDLPDEDDDGEDKPTPKKELVTTVTHTRLVTYLQSLTFRPVMLPDSQADILKWLIRIAQATDKLIEAEINVESDEYCDQLRKSLNREYDTFVENHGKVSTYSSWFAHRNSFWVDYRLVQYALSLENGAGQKVDLFYKRQTRPRTIPSGQIFFDELESDRITKAFWWCRSYFCNQVDLEQIAEKSNSNAEIVEDTLLALGLIDRMPKTESRIKEETVESSVDDDLEIERQNLESHWQIKPAVEQPIEKARFGAARLRGKLPPQSCLGKFPPESCRSDYEIEVRDKTGKITRRTVTGIIGSRGYLAVTTDDPCAEKDDFPLAHLASGHKLAGLDVQADAIACMNRLEAMDDLIAILQEPDAKTMSKKHGEALKLMASVIGEYL